MKLLSYETALSFKAKLCFNAVVKREDHAKAETNKSFKFIHLQLRKMTEKKKYFPSSVTITKHLHLELDF